MFQQIRAERGERGFTLVELLVVIAILGVLAGVAVFSLTNVGNGALEVCKTEKSMVNTAIAVAKAQGNTTDADIISAANAIVTGGTYYTAGGSPVVPTALGGQTTC